ncbi:MAG: hypothetical protein TU35_000330 [Thermoproteus sp. AZ2]|jgi:hypothetical protein|uniref:Uncharacterized protein n=1 Tax=Thermoproteus sp. AZ2 TaxID=1609232 RepID=A0ACC6UYS4_9CREN|nr:MAG: hypothetical protein TU35_06405 [Thermoproteus sp. AZ2]
MIEALRRAVGDVLGVYDAPDWLAAELLGDLGGWRGFDEALIRRLVELNSAKLWGVLQRNLEAYRPGRGGVRRAAPYLVAELIEARGVEPAFIRLGSLSVPAVPRGRGLYTPVIPVVEAKRPLLYALSSLSKWAGRYVVASAVESVPGVRLEIRRLKRPPYYYAVAEGLWSAVDRAGALRAPLDKSAARLYGFWREYRSRGFLVLAGRDVGGVRVDVLAVGLGKYGAVAGAGPRRMNRLSKFLDAVYRV